MDKKKRYILFIVGILLFIKIIDLIEQRRSVQNVFDEMIINEARLLMKSENICNVHSAKPYYDYFTMEYKHIDGNISSEIYILFSATPIGLDVNEPLYITFKPHDEAGNVLGVISFAYYKSANKLYIYNIDIYNRYTVGTIAPLPLGELEAYKDYLLYDVIIGSYLDNGKSRFSMDNLGEFEVIDYLMPYEYCGMPDREVKRTEIDAHGVSYTIWLETDSISCIQQTIQHDDRIVRGTGLALYHPIMLTDEIFGRDTGASRFAVQIDGKDCELSDLIEIDDGFIEWIKSSGQAEGNLQRISPDRETGCRKTQQMLQYFPEEQMQTVLENCEFYIEPGYLHVRFPYWDYERKEPGFVMNGNDLWRGWLTMKTDDIERFLKVEKW